MTSKWSQLVWFLAALACSCGPNKPQSLLQGSLPEDHSILTGETSCINSTDLSDATHKTSQTSGLVATTGPNPTALEHRLTADDVDRLRRHYPRTLERIRNYAPLLVEDIINMTRAGVADEVIIHEVKVTRSSFCLTLQEEEMLQQSGVSKRVIAMILFDN